MFKFLRNIFSKEAEASWVHCGTYLDTNHYYAADDCYCVNCLPDSPAYSLVKVFKKHTRDNKWQMKEKRSNESNSPIACETIFERNRL